MDAVWEDVWGDVWGDVWESEPAVSPLSSGTVKPKYGTGFKWGNGWKYGYGTSEPWIPSAGADRFSIESLEDPSVDYSADLSTLMHITGQGELRIRYPGYPDEVFYLISPDGTSFRVTNNGTTGAQTISSGFTGTPIGMNIADSIGGLWTARISNLGELTITNQTTGLSIEVNSTPTYTQETP